MSEEQIDKLLKRFELILKLEHIESMLLQESLPKVEGWDEKEMAFFIGQTLGPLFKTPCDKTPEEDMVCYEALYLERREIFSMIREKAEKSISDKATEAEKLAILRQERG